VVVGDSPEEYLGKNTKQYMWGCWLPKSIYDYADKPDFELFPMQRTLKSQTYS
jgi:hypothetical protein